jgi:hypothetical protein
MGRNAIARRGAQRSLQPRNIAAQRSIIEENVAAKNQQMTMAKKWKTE